MIQPRNERSWEKGTMCVRGLHFLMAEEVIGEFEATGVVGLAPSKNKDNSIIELLYNQNQIQEKRVGLNFENPLDND